MVIHLISMTKEIIMKLLKFTKTLKEILTNFEVSSFGINDETIKFRSEKSIYKINVHQHKKIVTVSVGSGKNKVTLLKIKTNSTQSINKILNEVYHPTRGPKIFQSIYIHYGSYDNSLPEDFDIFFCELGLTDDEGLYKFIECLNKLHKNGRDNVCVAISNSLLIGYLNIMIKLTLEELCLDDSGLTMFYFKSINSNILVNGRLLTEKANKAFKQISSIRY